MFAVRLLVAPFLLACLPLAAAASPLPVAFEANRGQSDASVAFVARGASATLFVTPAALVSVLPASAGEPSVTVYTSLRRAAATPLVGLEPLPGVVHHLVGDSAYQGIPLYARIAQRAVLPGIDLILYMDDGAVAYDFELAPGADPDAIVLDFAGAAGLSVSPEGDLLVHVGARHIRHRRPVAWQTIAGARVPVAVAWAIDGAAARFALGAYDPRHALLIDPPLAYSTFLGGSSLEQAKGVTSDAEGYLYVVGHTQSPNFPKSAGALPVSTKSNAIAFVAKLDPSASGPASLVWSTYLGGTSGGDFLRDVAVDAQGHVYVVGWSTANDFPVTASRLMTCSPISNGNGILSKLAADGASLVYSTCIGGNNVDELNGVVVDAAQRAHIVGRSASSDFPTSENALQAGNSSYLLFDAVALTIDTLAAPEDALVYATYFGGCADDEGEAIAVDGAGVFHLTGASSPGGSCPASAWKSKSPVPRAGGVDAWVTKLDPSLAPADQLVFSTFLGGSGDEDGHPSGGIDVDAQGNVFVVGTTGSADFPLSGTPLKASLSGNLDGFFSVFSPLGAPLYSTYLGGSFNDFAYAVRVGSNGLAYVAGLASGSDMPVSSCTFQGTAGGGGDAYLMVIDPWSASLVYATFLGGFSTDRAFDLTLDADDNAVLVGEANSSSFPVTAGAFQTSSAGASDVFVSKLHTPAECQLPGVRIADTSVVEGNAGSVYAVFDVHLFGAAPAPVTLLWETVDDSALDGEDYLAAGGDVTFAVGQTHATIAVEVLGDWAVEPDERFYLQLAPGSGGAALQDSLAIGRIIDDDVPASVTPPADVSVDEGALASAGGSFTQAPGALTLSASVGTLVVDWAAGTYLWSLATSDGPDQSQSVTLTLSDEAGALAGASFALAVANVAPAVTLAGPEAVAEGTTHSYTFTVADPGDDAFVATPSCGAFAVLVAGSLLLDADGGSFACAFGPGAATTGVAVDVADEDGAPGSATLAVAIADVPPALALMGATSVGEGEVHGYSFAYAGGEPAASFTPGCGAAGLLVGELLFSVASGEGSFQCHFGDGPAQTQVTLLVVDEAAATASAALAVSVANLAPSVALAGPGALLEGAGASYLFTVSDAGSDGFSVDGDPDCGASGVYLAGSLLTGDGGGTFGCLFPDGPADSQVTIGVSDEDGAASAPDSVGVSVANQPPQVDVSGPNGVAEGAGASFAFNVADAGDDALVLGEVACGAAGTLVPGSLSAAGDNPLSGSFACAFGDGPADSEVTVAASDSDGAAASAGLEVAVMDRAPIVALSGAESADEGSSASYTFSVDSAGSDSFVLAAGYPDCGAAGAAGSLVLTSAGGSFACAFADGDALSEVAVQVVDGDGGVSNVAFLEVSVEDVAPSVTLAGPTSLAADTTADYFFSVADPGVDTFALAFGAPDCGAGVLVAGSLSDGGGVFTCAFPAPGATTVSLQVESDGLVSNVAALGVTVGPVSAVAASMGGHARTQPSGVSVRHGFALDCDAAAPDQQLQVSWATQRFQLEQVATLACHDDPAYDPGGGVPIDVVSVTGIGRLDGLPGASIEATFVDAGEPGTNDWVAISIRDPSGGVVLEFAGALLHGNHQAAF